MQKDEKPLTNIEEFNRSHRRIKREEKDWYVPYLPRGLGMEDITEKEDRDLMVIFTRTEEEMESKFDDMVRERFQGYFESLTLVDLIEFLPQKPFTISFENLKREDRNAIKEIYFSGLESGYIKKTIRKQVRKYLKGKGYLKPREKEVKKDTKKELVKDRRKGKKKAAKKFNIKDIDVNDYFPQKPIQVQYEDLKKVDRKPITMILRTGLEASYVKKTIRKQIRKFLSERGYMKRKAEPSLREKKKAPKSRKDVSKDVKAKDKEILKVKAPIIDDYLPQKPVQVTLSDLKKADRRTIEGIFEIGVREGYLQKTIRKQIRKHLQEQGYFEETKNTEESKIADKQRMATASKGTKRPAKEEKMVMVKQEKETMISRKKVIKSQKEPVKTGRQASREPKKTPPTKSEAVEMDIDTFLPKRPHTITMKDLKTADRKVVMKIVSQGQESGLIQKTIRKQIRSFLKEKGYIL